MTDNAPAKDLLSIRKFRVRHLLPAGASRSTPARFERALRAGVSESQTAATPSDPRLIFIRRLELECAISAAWDDGQLAAAIRRALLAALADTVRGGVADNGVVAFESSDQFVASYLLARAVGSGGDAWFYRRFDGLRVLTPSMAIRTLANDGPDAWVGAVRLLNPEQQERVLAALSPLDAGVIVGRLVAARPPASDLSDTLVSRTIDVWQRAVGRRRIAARSETNDFLRALAWTLALIEHDRQLPYAAAVRVALAFSLLKRQLSEPSTLSSEGDVLEVLEPAARRQMGLPLYNAIRPLLHNPIRGRLVKAVREVQVVWKTSPGVLAIDTAAVAAPRATPFGGLFLLAPFLDEACRGLEMSLAGPRDTSAEAILRYVVARYCCGTRGSELASDLLWRDLFGLSPTLSNEDVQDWLTQSCDPPPWRRPSHSDMDYLAGASAAPFSTPLNCALAATAYRTMRLFASRMRGFQNAGLSHLFKNFLDCDAVVHSLEDQLRVELEKPPLHLLLTMSTIMNRMQVIDWLDQRPFCLTFDRAA